MSLLAHADQVQGLTRVFESVAASCSGAAARLKDLNGPGDALQATIVAGLFSREPTGPGTQNATERAIQAAPTRTALVGNFDPVFGEMALKLFSRPDSLVGMSKIDAQFAGMYLQFFTRLVVNV